MNLKNPNLAVNGGKPIRTKGWTDNITCGEEEKKALLEVIDSGYLSKFEGSHTPDPPFSFYGGKKVQTLEKMWCEYYECQYAISMNSATSGLYAAIGALGLGFGDEVIVSPYTMSACATAPMIYGAIPIFADVSLESGALLPESIEKLITPRTKGILVVHQFGIPADMDSIMTIAKKHNIKVIEDCAQAHGAKYKNKYVGTIGDIGIFSLNVNKTIQSGEGAVCITNDPDLHYRLALIRNHGEAVVGPANYENITNILGFNYRMTELQATVSIEQLKKLPYLNQERIGYVKYLAEELQKFGCFLPLQSFCSSDTKPTFYIFPVRYLSEKTGINRHDFIQAVNAEGIIFYQGYTKPLYLQPVYQQKRAFKHGYPFSAPENQEIKTNYELGSCPNAEQLYFQEMVINEHIRLPHTLDDMKDIVTAIDKVLNS